LQPKYLEGLQEFLNGIKIETNGKNFKIIWPENDAGAGRFGIYAGPDRGMMEFALGKPVSSWPPAYNLFIDTRLLEQNISCADITPRYVVPKGYDQDDMAGYKGLRDARLGRMKNSAVLRETVSTAFREALGNCWDKWFGVTTTVKAHIKATPAAHRR
jgi:hypothetical protein